MRYRLSFPAPAAREGLTSRSFSKDKVLATILTQHGLHQVFLGRSGLLMIRRQRLDGTWSRGYNIANVQHGKEIAKSGALAGLEPQ